MAKENEAWFEGATPEVEGFDFDDCPHGVIRRDGNEEYYPFKYICERCGTMLEAHDPN